VAVPPDLVGLGENPVAGLLNRLLLQFWTDKFKRFVLPETPKVEQWLCLSSSLMRNWILIPKSSFFDE